MASERNEEADPLPGLLVSVAAETHLLKDDGVYPNNARLPLLIYPQALCLTWPNMERSIQDLFSTNLWHGSWINGVYGYHHYHSTAHEVLAVSAGTAQLQFGGPQGILATARAGDVVVVPAGVAHKHLNSHGGFTVIGAYPRGQHYNMCYGKTGERPRADARITAVPLPERDPLYGRHGPLCEHWPPQPA